MAAAQLICVIETVMTTAEINCVASLQFPRQHGEDDTIIFLDTLVPCYYNPAISPILCSMHYTPQRHRNFPPGNYHIVAKVQNPSYFLHCCTDFCIFRSSHSDQVSTLPVLSDLKTCVCSWKTSFKYSVCLYFFQAHLPVLLS